MLGLFAIGLVLYYFVLRIFLRVRSIHVGDWLVENLDFEDEIANEYKKKFIKGEERYGKEEWVKKYEIKWNVDLYLDIGAIRHGVRAV